MYSYKWFEIDGVFTLLRPAFAAILVLSLLLFVMFLLPSFKKRWLNAFSGFALSVVFVIISGLLLFFSGILVDELGLGGDSTSFWMFLATVGISIVNVFLSFSTRPSEGRSKL